MNTQHLRLVVPEAAVPLQGPEDELRVLALRDRNAAIVRMIEQHRDRLFYHAMGIVRDSQEAYDVVQEVFIRAMREPRLFDEGFRIKAWLFRVTTNRCFNLVRDRKRRGAILEAAKSSDGMEAVQPDQVFAGQRRVEMLAAIQKMSEEHRQILMLRYYDDLSYAEIAEVLDIKLGTVMSRLSRARVRLVDLLGRSGTGHLTLRDPELDGRGVG